MIRKAQFKEADFLSELALRSKSHWGYSEEFIEACRPHIKIDEAYIENWPVNVYEGESGIVGFYSLKEIEGEFRLDNLWIEPKFIKQGFGKKLFNHSLQEAKKMQWNYFRLASEKYSVNFYEKLGMNIIGKIQSRLGKDIYLTHMELKFQ